MTKTFPLVAKIEILSDEIGISAAWIGTKLRERSSGES
jgi:hypothetical protein